MAKTAFAAKRIAAFTADPEDLVLITDSKHALYDARVTLPLDSGFLASINRRGVVEPVVVRKIDSKPVVIDGRQRVRGAREVNKKRKAEGLPLIKVPFVERKGDAADAYGVTVELNEHRTEDELRIKIEKAHRLAQLGYSPDDIAPLFKGSNRKAVTKATVKRWLAMDPLKRSGEKKSRGKATRPGAKQIEALVERIRVHMTSREVALLDWVRGRSNGKDIAEHFLGTAKASKSEEART